MSNLDPTVSWRRRLPHMQRLGRSYFITWVTADRATLTSHDRAIVLKTVIDGHQRSFYLYVAVIMPDHVHTILTLDSGTTLSKTMKYLKSVSAHRIRRGTLWQEDYFDRIVRLGENLRQKADYVLDNPVRAGLAASVDDYPWIWRAWVEGERTRDERG